MRRRADQLVDAFDPAAVPRVLGFTPAVFTATHQQDKSDEYFLDSANHASFFLEEQAFGADGELRQAKALSINKLGHAMHDLDPVFRAFSRSGKVAALLRSLGMQTPVPVQSMYMFKQPCIGDEVAAHQDSTFLHTSPMTCTGLWVALEAGPYARSLISSTGSCFVRETTGSYPSKVLALKLERGAIDSPWL